MEPFCSGMKARYWHLILCLLIVVILPAFQLVTGQQIHWKYLFVAVPAVVLVWLAKNGAPLVAGMWLKWYLRKGQVVIARVKKMKGPSLLGERKLTVVWQQWRQDGGVQEIEDTLKVAYMGSERYQAGDWLRLWLRPDGSWRPVDMLLVDAWIAEMPVPPCLEAEGVTPVPLPTRH